MGPHEASAWSSVADFLELAVASGGLIPGTRGWKKRQQQRVRTHLNIPQVSVLGQPYAQAILTNALRHGLTCGAAKPDARFWPRSPISCSTRRTPLGTTDPLPRLRWLLGELHGGIALTQTGNLNQKFVQQNADRFGWDFNSPPRTEDDLYDLHQVRELAQKLGLARRAARQLTLTAKGRRLADDPEQLWRMVPAAPLVGDSDFTAYMGELFLAMLLEADPRPFDEILATVWRAAGEEGFREDRTGEPPSEHDVSWAIHNTSNLCRALGLLTSGPDWRDRSYGLTETGKATALEALRTRATGPRTIPWP
jgi:hypothetical protein